jgi:hypothetical protein
MLNIEPTSIPAPRPHDKVVISGADTTQGITDLFQVIPDTSVIVTGGAFDFVYLGTIVDRITLQSYSAIGVPSWSNGGTKIVFVGQD